MVAAGGAVFLVVELTFLLANLTKFVEGGWAAGCRCSSPPWCSPC